MPYAQSEIGALITSHEFGHSFGNLLDQYSLFPWFDSDVPLGGRLAADPAGCPRWCGGTSVSIETLKSFDCNNLYDDLIYDPIYLEQLTNHPCLFSVELILNISDANCASKKDPVELTPQEKELAEGDSCYLLKTKSINIVNYCGVLSESDCRNDPICYWVADKFDANENPIANLDPYFQSQCIPQQIQSNIGVSCIEETGCYQGSGYSKLLWRPTFKGSIMRAGESGFGYNNEFDPVEKIHLQSLFDAYTTQTLPDEGFEDEDEFNIEEDRFIKPFIRK